jgi:hypothetical protein
MKDRRKEHHTTRDHEDWLDSPRPSYQQIAREQIPT